MDSKKDKLPHFIIAGAMKSGTTSLHYILNQHDDIYIPDGEIFFFDIDDIVQHPDFFVKTSKVWTFHDYNQDFDVYLKWYQSFFLNANNDQIIGEDSTTYIASEKAPSRIADLLPEVKLIFMLRDPVRRTYSQYQHLLQTGRATHNFDKTLQLTPNLIERSFYKKQIERYMQYFPKENLKFILFEEFVDDTQQVIDDVCDFLKIRHMDLTDIDTHKNLSRVPRSTKLQLLYNSIFRNVSAKKYLNSHLPHMDYDTKSNHIAKTIDFSFKKINLASGKKYGNMDSQTKVFLERLFAKENKGISELIGKNVNEYWLYMDNQIDG